MVSELIKEGRVSKGYTQKELSELSHISVRSIQRIENGEIEPRSYTLKTLAGILGISFENIQKTEPAEKHRFKISKSQKIILSISLPVLLVVGCWAFIAQSPRFPETTFELLVFIGGALLAISIFLLVIWRAKS